MRRTLDVFGGIITNVKSFLNKPYLLQKNIAFYTALTGPPNPGQCFSQAFRLLFFGQENLFRSNQFPTDASNYPRFLLISLVADKYNKYSMRLPATYLPYKILESKGKLALFFSKTQGLGWVFARIAFWVVFPMPSRLWKNSTLSFLKAKKNLAAKFFSSWKKPPRNSFGAHEGVGRGAGTPEKRKDGIEKSVRKTTRLKAPRGILKAL